MGRVATPEATRLQCHLFYWMLTVRRLRCRQSVGGKCGFSDTASTLRTLADARESSRLKIRAIEVALLESDVQLFDVGEAGLVKRPKDLDSH